MRWFGKKEEEHSDGNLELPRLPELPRINDVEEHGMDDGDYGDSLSKSPLPRLPSYPNTHFGNSFSKNVIKDAVVGKKEDDDFDAEEFADDSFSQGMMQTPRRQMSKEMFDEDEPSEMKYPAVRKPRTKETEPIYIRLDKFNESAKMFESTLEKVNDIQRTLSEIKKIRQEEETDLGEWEKEIQEIKRQLDRIDREIFSGI